MTMADPKGYSFTLVFDVTRVALSLDAMIDRLYECGCDDALVGIGRPGVVALDFTRDEVSATEAVTSAISGALRALPGAVLQEVEPDFVGVSEIADFVGCSRQNVRKLLMSRTAGVPMPIHSGSCGVWHLAPVLRWLRDSKAYDVDPILLDTAEVAQEVNTATTHLSLTRGVERFEQLLAESRATYGEAAAQ